MRKLCTTSRAAIRLLSVRGQHAIGLHQQIQSLIRSRTGNEAAVLLLAEPQLNAGRDEISWFTPADGEIRRLSDLLPDARTEVEATYAALIATLQGLVRDLQSAQSAENEASRDIELLTAAMRYCDGDCLYAVGGQPVVVNWAAEPATPQGRPVDMMLIAPPPPPGALAGTGAALAASEGEGASRRRFAPWSPVWILAGLLMLAVILTFWCMMGWTLFGWRLPICSLGCAQPLSAGQEIGRLNEDIAHLRDAMRGRRSSCVASEAPRDRAAEEQPPQPPTAPPQDEESRRVEQRGGKAGNLEVTLVWNSIDDIDLLIGCPSGEQIEPGKKACSGSHDIDSNLCEAGSTTCPEANRATTTPVEHVTWPNDPPSGEYIVRILNYTARTSLAGQTFKLSVKVNGEVKASDSAQLPSKKKFVDYRLSMPDGVLTRK